MKKNKIKVASSHARRTQRPAGKEINGDTGSVPFRSEVGTVIGRRRRRVTGMWGPRSANHREPREGMALAGAHACL
jgi:hypothetical protein